ncbi:CDP-alcohol phosphatidyltransferase family protein [uncultured Muriicola sp.]|uniref:CDP-alcohol phosphatidyltransferase family protein n=1 Tax=uncultured Muriicola sp. TaxID=1583102 RepID=UPI0026257715|nr:CDP-alcohol phosphatidyltransferase family protein [uncultured Muriicola sp.]
MKQHIPNILTLLNVFSGCLAVLFAVWNKWELMAFFVFLGLLFDFLDGLSARALKVQSPLGIQLDSLADMITFGLVPGIVMFQLLTMSETGGWNLKMTETMNWDSFYGILPFFGFAITLSSAYRLARFNIDENQATSFIGLPTPANALLIISLPLILMFNGNDALNSIILNPWFLIILTVISSLLLNAPIPLFALKFKTWDFKDNAVRYIFILVSLVFIGTMKFLAIPAIIIFYLLSSFLLPHEEKKD